MLDPFSVITCGQTTERSGPALATGGRSTNELVIEEVKRAEASTVGSQYRKREVDVPSIDASCRQGIETHQRSGSGSPRSGFGTPA